MNDNPHESIGANEPCASKNYGSLMMKDSNSNSLTSNLTLIFYTLTLYSWWSIDCLTCLFWFGECPFIFTDIDNALISNPNLILKWILIGHKVNGEELSLEHHMTSS